MAGEEPPHPGPSGPGPASTQEDARRERKRATDRKSQRDHRERQKAYIRQLEETVRTLRSDCTADERVAALLAEQERLQKANAKLTSQLDRVRSIVSEDKDDDASSSATLRGPFSSDLIVSSGSPLPVGPHPSNPAQAHTIPALPGLPPQHSQHFPWRDASLGHPELQLNLPAATHNLDAVLSSVPSSLMPDNPSSSTVPISSTSHPVPLMSHAPRVAAPARPNVPPLDLAFTLPGFNCLPQYSSPQGIGDSSLLGMIEEARTEFRNGRFNMVDPTLKQLLAEKPYDILSFRLFHYLRGYGGMPLHIMLAIFWTQYLFLRWNVVQTQSSYLAMPDYYKPLPIQCHIPHRIIIDTLVWPALRSVLIQEPEAELETMAMELLGNLSPAWNPTYSPDSGSLMASLDVVNIVEQQACSLEFWKVGPGFAKRYPHSPQYIRVD